jgi:hypothetical protein
MAFFAERLYDRQPFLFRHGSSIFVQCSCDLECLIVVGNLDDIHRVLETKRLSDTRSLMAVKDIAVLIFRYRHKHTEAINTGTKRSLDSRVEICE